MTATSRTLGEFQVPAGLPVIEFDVINERVSQQSVGNKTLWHAFASAWNALAYRLRAAQEHCLAFSESVGTSRRRLRLRSAISRITICLRLSLVPCRRSSAFISPHTALEHWPLQPHSCSQTRRTLDSIPVTCSVVSCRRFPMRRLRERCSAASHRPSTRL